MHPESLSHGLWKDTAPAAPQLTPLEGGHRTDVAIIGGGYTGLSAALHLAEAGTDVTLLEARQVGFGGAGRNVGLVNAGLWLMPEEVERLVGKAHGSRLVEVLGKSPDLVFGLIDKHAIPCEAIRKGTLHLAHSRGGLRALEQREAQWQKRGAPVKLLGRTEAASRIGSDAFHGALFDARAGTVQPLAYAYGLATAAKNTGATLYDQSPVIDCAYSPQGWRLKTPEGNLLATFVILAVQGYADFAFKKIATEIIPFNFFQFATAPLSAEIRRTILPGGEGAWDTALILSSFRMDSTGRLVVGSVGQVENSGFSLHESWTHRTLARIFPQIGRTTLDYAWNGRIAMTGDHIPRFHLRDRDMATITSYNGRGIGPGTVFGKLLAGLAQGASPDTIPLPVSTPKGIPTRGVRGLFYETGARIYHFFQ